MSRGWREFASGAHANRFGTDRPVSQGEDNDRLYARSSLPIQARSNRSVAAANCVAVVKQQGVANAGEFSVKLAPKVATAPSVAAGGSMKPDSPQNLSSEMQTEAIELASNFILKTTLHNPRVLSRSETPIAVASTGAAWSSDEAVGFVRIVPPKEGVKGLDVASAVVAMDAHDCKGKFASGRTSELVDSDVVFRGFSSCDDSSGPRISQYFIV